MESKYDFSDFVELGKQRYTSPSHKVAFRSSTEMNKGNHLRTQVRYVVDVDHHLSTLSLCKEGLSVLCIVEKAAHFVRLIINPLHPKRSTSDVTMTYCKTQHVVYFCNRECILKKVLLS